MANTSQGRMVGDYISTSYAGGLAHGVFALASAPSGSVFNEALFTTSSGLAAAQTNAFTAAAVDQPVPNATPDHPASTEPLTSR